VVFDQLHQRAALCSPDDDWKTRTVEPAHGVQIGAKKGVAPTKRLLRFFNVAWLNPHIARIGYNR
jgi:hypothetical protein